MLSEVNLHYLTYQFTEWPVDPVGTTSVLSLRGEWSWFASHQGYLWPPYVIGQAIIFLPCGFFSLSCFFYLS